MYYKYYTCIFKHQCSKRQKEIQGMVNVSIVIHDNNIFPSVQYIRYDYSTQCWIARTLESWQKDFSDLRNIIDLLGKKTLHFSNCRNWGWYRYFTNSKSVCVKEFLIYDLQNLQFMKNGFIVLFGFVLFAFINDFYAYHNIQVAWQILQNLMCHYGLSGA